MCVSIEREKNTHMCAYRERNTCVCLLREKHVSVSLFLTTVSNPLLHPKTEGGQIYLNLVIVLLSP